MVLVHCIEHGPCGLPLESLCRCGILASTELVEHSHQPYWLVECPASLGKLRVPSYELGNLVLDRLTSVLLDPKVEQLDGSTVKVYIERSSQAGVAAADRLSLEPTRMLAG